MGRKSKPSPYLLESVPLEGYTRISMVRHMPEVLRSFGVDPAAALGAAGVRLDIFEDLQNVIEYTKLQRLLEACVQLTGCDYVTMLIGQHTRLSDFGLAGRASLCAATAGEALHTLIDHYNLHSTAATANLLDAGHFRRFVYAISVGGIVEAAQFHLGAVTIAFNILQDLFGDRWRPVAVTFATHAPSDLRPFQRYFSAPLRFDSGESAVIFEQHWLDAPLPPVEATYRRQVEAEVRRRRAELIADFPATVRRLLRKQLIIGHFAMEDVASLLGMHRRTLDRNLQRHGVRYGELRDDVKADVSMQLLRSTAMPVQQIAESLHFSTAANFTTAFRRWTGVTPSDFRRNVC